MHPERKYFSKYSKYCVKQAQYDSLTMWVSCQYRISAEWGFFCQLHESRWRMMSDAGESKQKAVLDTYFY